MAGHAPFGAQVILNGHEYVAVTAQAAGIAFTDLSQLADTARQAGLPDPEITRTLDSARRTAQPNPGYEPEAGDDK